MFVYKPQELHKIEKFADETIFVSIDLKEILEPNELAVSISKVTSIPKLEKVRTRKGKMVECKIMPTVFDSTAAFIDYKISIQVETSYGSIRSINFICKVYR